MKSNSKHKAFALTKTRAAPLIAAALMTLIALFGITACPNNVEGAVTGTANGGYGGASLILSPDKLTIRVTVTTSDNSPITVEGCDKTKLTSGTQTELKAKNTGVVLKGKITKLQVGDVNLSISNKLTALNVQGLSALQYLNCCGNKLTALNVQGLSALQYLNCGYNQLTALNVQGCTALQKLYCSGNQLTADAFTKLFNDLPLRTVSQDAKCRLYTEQSGVTEGNHKDFTSPGELKTAFDNAKTVKRWKMYKCGKYGFCDVEI